MRDLHVGDRTKYGARICSVVRCDGEIVQVGVRDHVGHDGFAPHWGVDPETETAVTKIRYWLLERPEGRC